jgi:hypothetical protein
MSLILLPANKPEDWQPHLGDPQKHWKSGHSAKALAYCWQEAQGFPNEVKSVLTAAGNLFSGLEPLLILPEHKVSLPGRSTASQSDIWILAKSENQLFSIAVEGKVSESFGEPVNHWILEDSKGKQERLEFLIKKLGIRSDFDKTIRYQLLHRTASAVIEAERFLASHAMLIIHSFSPTNEWFEDFAKFVSLFGSTPKVNSVVSAKLPNGMPLHFAWIHGNEEYLKK